MGISAGLGVDALRAGVVTSSTRPTSPYEGQVIYETDTNRVLVWDASAWVAPNSTTANPPGLEKITPTISSAGGTAASVSGGVVSIGNGNTSVTVTAFSADYENYVVVMNRVLASSGNPGAYMTIGNAATAYYSVTAYWAYDNSGDGTAKRNNSTEWNTGYFGANHYSAQFTIYGPFVALRTAISGSAAGDLYESVTNGMLANNNSYTSFTIAPSSGSFTGGTIRVYVYRN